MTIYGSALTGWPYFTADPLVFSDDYAYALLVLKGLVGFVDSTSEPTSRDEKGETVDEERGRGC